jgi:hypothetical protein
VKKALQILFQLALYVPLMVLLGYFSTEPRFTIVPESSALVCLSFVHAAERLQECRERTPEELAKLAPNMRAPLDCPRERAPVTIELEMDGKPLFHIVAPPSGIAGDGASTVYRRIVVEAGRHHFRLRLSDTARGDFSYTAERSVELAAGRVLLIDFNAAAGGFVFRL